MEGTTAHWKRVSSPNHQLSNEVNDFEPYQFCDLLLFLGSY